MPRERIARATMLMTKIKPSRTSPAAPAGAPKTVGEGGEEERGGFPGDACEGQQNGGEDAAIRSRHDDRGDGFPLAGAEGHGGFAQSAGHTAQKLFRAA